MLAKPVCQNLRRRRTNTNTATMIPPSKRQFADNDVRLFSERALLRLDYPVSTTRLVRAREPLGDAAATEADQPPAVSVHVRRSDYLKPGTLEYHWDSGRTLFTAKPRPARSPASASRAELFVFSDDTAAAGAGLEELRCPSRGSVMFVAMPGVPGKIWR